MHVAVFRGDTILHADLLYGRERHNPTAQSFSAQRLRSLSAREKEKKNRGMRADGCVSLRERYFIPLFCLRDLSDDADEYSSSTDVITYGASRVADIYRIRNGFPKDIEIVCHRRDTQKFNFKLISRGYPRCKKNLR